ncbi:uncharacterized protein [Miscanthus floridulus]|uniref:uncharacterized protein isoform X3 n=1 Tax=Miscanthus floridulus TaxID=154761 RepID=UPI0034582D58
MEAEGAAAENGGAGKESGSRFRRVCVFCGSSSGKRSSYRDAAVELGKERVARKVDLVYGGPCHWRHTHHSHGQAGGPAERGRVLRLPAGVHRQGGGRRLHQALPAPHLRQRPRRQGTRPQAGGDVLDLLMMVANHRWARLFYTYFSSICFCRMMSLC